MRLVRSALLTLVLAGAALAAAAAPAMASPATSWSTATRASHRVPAGLPVLADVRTAHHPGFDRITFELSGPLPGYRIGYVPSLTEDPSGRPVDLAGSATIEVVLQPAQAHANPLNSGAPTVDTEPFSPGLPALKEVDQTGDFENVVSYGLGIDHRASFRVLELTGPSRLAIDVATSPTSPSPAAGTPVAPGPAGSGPAGPGSLPFTGPQSTRLLLTGLGLAAVGVLVLALARKTRTP